MGKVEDMRRQRELLFAQRERAIKAREAAEDKPSSAPAKEPPAARAAVREAPESTAADDEKPAGVRTKLGRKLKPEAKAAKPSKIPARTKGKAAEPELDDKPADEKPSVAKPTAKRTGKSAGKAADEVGTCSVCRKPKPVRNGLVSNHMKGLGKACAGSRKPPL